MRHYRATTAFLGAAFFWSPTSVILAQCEVQEDAKLTESDAVPNDNDHFGGAVSVSGDTAIVGAGLDDCAAGLDCGSAYIYRFNGSAWIQEAKLTASDAGALDRFGSSVTISGDVVVVGAYGDDCAGAGAADCGSAYVYRFNGSTWVEEHKLTAADAAQGDQFGISVSVSGDTAIVGANQDDCATGGNCGSAYVFRYNGSTWVHQAKLTASDAALGDHFGQSVSVSGAVAVVGASQDDCTAGPNCGSA